MITPDRPSERHTDMLLLFVVVIWAANYPAAKYAIEGLDLFVFNGVRYVVAAVVLAAIFFSRSSWQHIERADWPKLIRAGIVANVLYQMMFIVGLRMTTAGNSAILLATSPLWTIFIDSRIHRSLISLSMWLGMALSLCGIFIIVFGSSQKLEIGGMALVGDLLSLAAAFLWGFSTNLQKPLLVRYSPTQVALVMISAGAVGLSLVAVPPALTARWMAIDWKYYLAAILSGALSIGLGNAVWSHGVKKLGPGRTANYSNLVPVLALVISYFGLEESLTYVQCIGAGVTLVGVWVARR